MSTGAPEPGAKGRASAKPRLVAHRDNVPADSADGAKSQKMPDAQGHRDDEAPLNPLALVLGLVVILALIFGTLFIINQMRCNPLYSDSGLVQPNKCQ